MDTKDDVGAGSSWRELADITLRVRDMWRLIPARLKVTLGGALVIMSLGGAANTLIPLYLGKLVDSVNHVPVPMQESAPLRAQPPCHGT